MLAEETTAIIPVEVRPTAPLTLPDTVSRSIAPIEAKVEGLDEATPFDELVNVLGLITDIKRLLEAKRHEVEDKAIAYIDRHGDQVVGDVRYFAGASKSYKSKDLVSTAESLMQACGGDWRAFVDVLSVNAFKPSEARKILGERFGELFETKIAWKLVEGKPVAGLQKIDTKFLK
jgi:hypothetical protein